MANGENHNRCEEIDYLGPFENYLLDFKRETHFLGNRKFTLMHIQEVFVASGGFEASEL